MQILKINNETFTPPDLNKNDLQSSNHRLVSFIDSEHVNKFCNKLKIKPNNLFLTISSFTLSKFVHNKNLLFANSGVIDNQLFDKYPLILNLNVISFLSRINKVWLNFIAYHMQMIKIRMVKNT